MLFSAVHRIMMHYLHLGFRGCRVVGRRIPGRNVFEEDRVNLDLAPIAYQDTEIEVINEGQREVVVLEEGQREW